MKKFRLVRQEEINDNGETIISFFIQKKWLFWWVHAVFETHYSNYRHDALLTNRKLLFCEEDKAMEFFNSATHPLKLIYKGNRIKKVFSESEREWVYVNLSNWSFYYGSTTYEYSKNLEVLKKHIDQRIFKKSISVIA